jgi:hypothetical protein
MPVINWRALSLTLFIILLTSHLSCSSQVGRRTVLRISIGFPVYGSTGLARAAISGEPRRRRLCM